MKQLCFDERYYKKLIKGRKTMTIRRGKRKFEIGEKVEVICGKRKLGIAKITNLVIKKFSDIDIKEVRKDGFRSKRKLKEALRKHYKNVKGSDIFTLIEFEWIEKYE